MWELLQEYTPSSIPGITITVLWATLVLYLILKLIVEKAWGAIHISRGMIARNEVHRTKRFDLIRKRLQQSSATDEQRVSILGLDFFHLKDALQDEKLSATDVLDAYVSKALEAHSKTNCVVEFIEEAFEQAQRLDETWRGNANKPTLFGMPFSVKGNMFVKGYDCSIGLAKNLFEPMSAECSLVTHLRGEGAVPFVITNVTQALLSFVCSNSVYGTTTHPRDPTRTPGGSSGGEAALLACGGCAFGTGSDLAGSTRIPASMCGVFTLKPTSGRLIVQNAYGGLPGCGRLGLGFGFFTKSVADLKFLCNNIIGSPSYHRLVPKSIPLPLALNRIDALIRKKLRIGYFINDGFMKPVPACERSVSVIVTKLKDQGHELVQFHVPHPTRAASLFYKNLMPDRGEFLLQQYNNEVISPHLQRFHMLLKVPPCIRTIASWALSWISPQMSLITRSYVSDLADLRYTQQLTDQYVQQFTEEWNAFELDALICPAFAVPSVRHEYPGELPMCAFATGLFNMLDYPAGVVPTGFVTQQDDLALNDPQSWPIGRNVALRKVREAAAGSVGLPLAVQVVALPYHEEECLAVMQLVEALSLNTSKRGQDHKPCSINQSINLSHVIS